ncbi:MAG: hypothetical protein COA96_10370 [SAR86 cluster bacterium]|uniref:Uncharacterized protein n=1 Tax=SAR86 cluster bacterium TaxID=2030880 RepID=A0A2A5AYG4_9GAMM|nr:MAG: hypothetical protein COA96_10370 [SAR86 cluster bacterium]
MKINLATIPLSHKKVPFLTPKGKATTLGEFCIEALATSAPSDAQATLEEKMNVHRLACLLNDVGDGEATLTAEDIVLLKNRMGELFNAIVVGACIPLLDDLD